MQYIQIKKRGKKNSSIIDPKIYVDRWDPKFVFKSIELFYHIQCGTIHTYKYLSIIIYKVILHGMCLERLKSLAVLLDVFQKKREYFKKKRIKKEKELIYQYS